MAPSSSDWYNARVSVRSARRQLMSETVILFGGFAVVVIILAVLFRHKIRAVLNKRAHLRA